MGSLARQAAKLGIRPPSIKTLRRYGLTAEDWLALLAGQGWTCGICLERSPHWNTDHEHLPGWKRLAPEDRKRYVRGVLCAYCNYQKAPSRMAAVEADRLAAYLHAYEVRRNA